MAPKGKYIAFVSAEVETENPEAELEAGLALLGPIDEKIIDMYDMYEPVNDCTLDNCYISKVSWGCFGWIRVGNRSGGGGWEKLEEMHIIKSNEAGDMEEILVWIYTQNGVLADM